MIKPQGKSPDELSPTLSASVGGPGPDTWLVPVTLGDERAVWRQNGGHECWVVFLLLVCSYCYVDQHSSRAPAAGMPLVAQSSVLLTPVDRCRPTDRPADFTLHGHGDLMIFDKGKLSQSLATSTIKDHEIRANPHHQMTKPHLRIRFRLYNYVLFHIFQVFFSFNFWAKSFFHIHTLYLHHWYNSISKHVIVDSIVLIL